MWVLFRQVGLFGSLASFRNNYDPTSQCPPCCSEFKTSKYFSDVKNDRLALYDSLYKSQGEVYKLQSGGVISS